MIYITQDIFYIISMTDYSKKNIMIASTISLLFAALGTEFATSETMSYIKVWNGIKDSIILLVTCYILSPCYKSIMSYSADDTLTICVIILICVYILTYDYESAFRKGEKEPFNRPTIKESDISLFIITLLMMLMCSRMRYIYQSFSHIMITIVYVYDHI